MPVKKVILYSLAALLLFTGFVLVRVPASLALNYIGSKSGFLAPYQVSGTVWNGSATEMVVRYGGSSLSLGLVEWQLSPWQLLLGKLSVHLDANKGSQKIAGDFSLALGNRLQVQDAEIHLDIPTLTSLMKVRLPGQLQGMAELSLERLSYEGGSVMDLAGTMVARDGVYVIGQPVVLGTYAAKLSLKDRLVNASLSDIDGAVTISGDVTVQPETREYHVNLTVRPKPDANPMIGQALAALTQQQPDGSFRITR